MASIEIRDTKDGKRAYRFRTLIGKDASGKRIFETTTWKPPEGLTAAKEKKLAETEAYHWDQQIKNGIPHTEQGAFTVPPAAAEPPPMEEVMPEEETFRYFAEQVWLTLKVVAGGLHPSTIAIHGFMPTENYSFRYKNAPKSEFTSLSEASIPPFRHFPPSIILTLLLNIWYDRKSRRKGYLS